MSSCTISSSNSFATFLNQSVFLIVLQKRLLFSASGITVCLCVLSNALKTSSGLIYKSDSACTTLFCCLTLNFLLSFDMTSSFFNCLRLILFNCSNSSRDTFCFSKIIFRQFGYLFPIISLFL